MLAPTLVTLPSMSRVPHAPFFLLTLAVPCSPFNAFYLFNSLKLARLPACSLLLSSLYLDHSHCLVLAPATLAALPSTRAIPNRDVFYVARPARSVLPSVFCLFANKGTDLSALTYHAVVLTKEEPSTFFNRQRLPRLISAISKPQFEKGCLP